MAIPACDTTPWPSADTFTCDATAIFFTCEVPSSWNDLNLRQVRLFLAGQALSVIYTPPQPTNPEKSGLAVSHAIQSRTGLSIAKVVKQLRPLRSATISINGATQTFPPAIPAVQREILTHLGIESGH